MATALMIANILVLSSTTSKSVPSISFNTIVSVAFGMVSSSVAQKKKQQG